MRPKSIKSEIIKKKAFNSILIMDLKAELKTKRSYFERFNLTVLIKKPVVNLAK